METSRRQKASAVAGGVFSGSPSSACCCAASIRRSLQHRPAARPCIVAGSATRCRSSVRYCTPLAGQSSRRARTKAAPPNPPARHIPSRAHSSRSARRGGSRENPIRSIASITGEGGAAPAGRGPSTTWSKAALLTLYGARATSMFSHDRRAAEMRHPVLGDRGEDSAPDRTRRKTDMRAGDGSHRPGIGPAVAVKTSARSRGRPHAGRALKVIALPSAFR